MQPAPSSNPYLPLKVRTRRTLSGNGEITVERVVSCPRRAGDMPLHACLIRECCAGFEETASGAHVLCEDPMQLALTRVHLPVRDRSEYSLLRRSRAEGTKVSTIMTADVLCVHADVSVDALVPLLLSQGISGVPVVDSTGAPLGIVSKTDLVREHYENGGARELREVPGAPGDGYQESDLGGSLVGDVMIGMTFALPEDATVSQACALMAYEGVHRVPVVSADGKVVGILSALDVLRWLASEDGYLLARRHT